MQQIDAFKHFFSVLKLRLPLILNEAHWWLLVGFHLSSLYAPMPVGFLKNSITRDEFVSGV